MRSLRSLLLGDARGALHGSVPVAGQPEGCRAPHRRAHRRVPRPFGRERRCCWSWPGRPASARGGQTPRRCWGLTSSGAADAAWPWSAWRLGSSRQGWWSRGGDCHWPVGNWGLEFRPWRLGRLRRPGTPGTPATSGPASCPRQTASPSPETRCCCCPAACARSPVPGNSSRSCPTWRR